MEKFRFLKWKVYQDTKELFVLILNVVKKIPKEYRFELGSQLIRASLSILLNIAVGSGKSSDRELNRFIDISLGSLNETLAAIDVLKDTKLITESDFNKIFKLIDEISNQLGGFKKKITSYKL